MTNVSRDILESADRRQSRRPPVPTMVLSYEDLWAAGIRISRSQLQRMENAGRFPRRVRLGGCGGWGRPGWLRSEIDEHLARLAAERDRVA